MVKRNLTIIIICLIFALLSSYIYNGLLVKKAMYLEDIINTTFKVNSNYHEELSELEEND